MSHSVQPHRQQPTRLPRPWDSPGKNTGLGCHFLLQIMVKNCPKLITDLKPHSKETQRKPRRKIPNIYISSLSILYLNCKKLKTKRKFWSLKENKNYLNYSRKRIRITSDLSSEIRQARREGSELFKMLKEKTNSDLEFCTSEIMLKKGN